MGGLWLFWSLMTLHLSVTKSWFPFGMHYRSWQYIVDHQESQADFDEAENQDELSLEAKNTGHELAKIHLQMCQHLADGKEADENFKKLKQQRNELEEKLGKSASSPRSSPQRQRRPSR